jgi:hypothetical protein
LAGFAELYCHCGDENDPTPDKPAASADKYIVAASATESVQGPDEECENFKG